jgi:hypothetical protein
MRDFLLTYRAASYLSVKYLQPEAYMRDACNDAVSPNELLRCFTLTLNFIHGISRFPKFPGMIRNSKSHFEYYLSSRQRNGDNSSHLAAQVRGVCFSDLIRKSSLRVENKDKEPLVNLGKPFQTFHVSDFGVLK